MTTKTLTTIGGVVALALSASVSALFFTVPLGINPDSSWAMAASLGSIGLMGIAAGGAVTLSARRGGRWAWVGLVLGVAYLGLALMPWVFLTTLHWYGPIALLVIGLSVANLAMGSHRPRV